MPAAVDYGELIRIESSNGGYLGLYYDTHGRIREAYTGDGRRLSYRYDNYGDLVQVTFPDASQIDYGYAQYTFTTNSQTFTDSDHLLVRELKPDGRVLQNEYDPQRRVTNQWATVGPDLRLVRTASFLYTNNYDPTNLTLTLTGTTTLLDYTNRATTYCYTNSLLRRVRDPLNYEALQEWYKVGETNPPASRAA